MQQINDLPVRKDYGPVKAAFFDIDGTLFSHRTCCIPESTLRALKCLHEKGILCVIVT